MVAFTDGDSDRLIVGRDGLFYDRKGRDWDATITKIVANPIMPLAYLKLRQRNLGPILDANGWAINGRARINVTFGAALTDIASLPPGSERVLDDAYADKERPWRLYIALGIVLLLALSWYAGKLDSYLPGTAKSVSVLGTNAPAYKPAPVKPEQPPPANKK